MAVEFHALPCDTVQYKYIQPWLDCGKTLHVASARSCDIYSLVEGIDNEYLYKMLYKHVLHALTNSRLSNTRVAGELDQSSSRQTV